jgi:DNA-binding transcriptional LysR family regulator
MQAELSEYADGVRGHVRMHANISAVVQFLPEDLGSFAREHPQVKIDLQEHLSSEVARAVHEGAADIGVCNTQGLALGAQLAQRPYRRDELVLVVPRGHTLAKKREITFEDSLEFDHVGLHSNSSIYVAMREAAAAAGRAIRLRIQVTGLDAMCRMIVNGLGVGVMPRRAFELMQAGSALHCVRLRDAWAVREINLVARDFDALPLTARLLVEHLQARAATGEAEGSMKAAA